MGEPQASKESTCDLTHPCWGAWGKAGMESGLPRSGWGPRGRQGQAWFLPQEPGTQQRPSTTLAARRIWGRVCPGGHSQPGRRAKRTLLLFHRRASVRQRQARKLLTGLGSRPGGGFSSPQLV